ncbi:MAG: hypothetical protein WA040_04040 [Anaerolineae bacterium]
MASAVEQQFQWAVQALAQPADVQIDLFPPFVVVADELALEFDSCREAFDSNFGWLWSPLQRTAVVALDQYLADMSGPDKPELWLDEGCLEHARWTEVRQLARKVLSAFGWSPDFPPLDRGAIYVGPPD